MSNPSSPRPRGRPTLPDDQRKRAITIKLSPDVIDAMKGSGPGWMVRADDALRQAFTDHR